MTDPIYLNHKHMSSPLYDTFPSDLSSVCPKQTTPSQSWYILPLYLPHFPHRVTVVKKFWEIYKNKNHPLKSMSECNTNVSAFTLYTYLE